ncbi:MAG: hypothetical protein RSB57_10180, partial [Hungatella sp.]
SFITKTASCSPPLFVERRENGKCLKFQWPQAAEQVKEITYQRFSTFPNAETSGEKHRIVVYLLKQI